MGENSAIAWTDHTFNPWIGCTKISPACTNCYAAVDTFARRSRANGLELWGPKAARHVTSEANWRKPLAWNRAAAKAGTRSKVFSASLADVFEDRPDLVAPRARLFRLILDTPNLDWLLLTKRPQNAVRLWLDAWKVASGQVVSATAPRSPWLPNIWLGTTVEDQQRADERIPELLATPAAVRFLSCEPLLGPVDVARWMWPVHERWPAKYSTPAEARADGAVVTKHRQALVHADCRFLDWVIVGGESGLGARPFDLAWARSLVAQCKAAGVAAFVKQIGSRPIDSARAGEIQDVGIEHRKGGDPAEWRGDLRVREFPEVRRGL